MAPPAVGLAWSGGGLTGFFSSMCATVALHELAPPGQMYSSSDFTVAANSGGTLGTILFDNSPKGRLRFPSSWEPFDYNATALASTFKRGPADTSVWFGAINDLVPSAPAGPGDLPASAPPAGDSGWWLSTLDVALKLYKLDEPLRPSSRPTLAGVALLREDAAPIKREPVNYTLSFSIIFIKFFKFETNNSKRCFLKWVFLRNDDDFRLIKLNPTVCSSAVFVLFRMNSGPLKTIDDAFVL